MQRRSHDHALRINPATPLILLFGLSGAASFASVDDEPAPVADRAASRAPAPWRANQHQRRSKVSPPKLGTVDDIGDAIPIIMAGSEEESPSDSPAARVDPNSPGAQYAGVCSLIITVDGVSGMCSGTPITPHHILTAGHCVDFYDGGFIPLGVSVTINFNVDGDLSHVIPPSGVRGISMHPDFTGFSNPAVNDDLVIITLNDPLPPEIPIYPVYRDELADGTELQMVGYGRSGHGDTGVAITAVSTVKRHGRNIADLLTEDDESGDALEVFLSDFDGANPATNCFGGLTLGNEIETSAAPGDSGGPSFVDFGGAMHVWGVNTFGSSCFGPAFSFGGRSGGIVVNAYLAWIDSVVECGGNCEDCNENGVLDGFDIMDGSSADVDRNGTPDECQGVRLTANDIVLSDFAGFHVYDDETGTAQFALGSAKLSAIHNIRLDARGSVYVIGRASDELGVWLVDPNTSAVIGQLAGPADGLNEPRDVAWGPDGRMYVLNQGAFSQPGGFVTAHDPDTGDLLEVFIADDPDTPELENAGLANARDFAFGPDGDLFITNQFPGTNGIHRFDGTTGVFEGLFADEYPNQIGFAPRTFYFRDDGMLYASTSIAYNVLRFDAQTGAYIDQLLDTDAIDGFFPLDFAFDQLGRMLVISDEVLYAFNAETGVLLGTLLDMTQFPYTNVNHMLVMPNLRPADLNSDGVVDAVDLGLLLGAWGDCPESADCPADLNDDGAVGPADLAELLGDWG